MDGIFRIGTSGWSYPASGEGSWNGVFYPPGKVDELNYYAERFNTWKSILLLPGPGSRLCAELDQKDTSQLYSSTWTLSSTREEGSDDTDPSGTFRRVKIYNPETVLHFNFFGLCRNLNWSDVKLNKL